MHEKLSNATYNSTRKDVCFQGSIKDAGGDDDTWYPHNSNREKLGYIAPRMAWSYLFIFAIYYIMNVAQIIMFMG